MPKRLHLIYVLIGLWFITMCYFIYNSGVYEAPRLQPKKLDSTKQKDKTIALYKRTIDSLKNSNDSLTQELDGLQNELARYVYSVDYLTKKDPKAADQFINYYLHETE